jgi:hypothetical protein
MKRMALHRTRLGWAAGLVVLLTAALAASPLHLAGAAEPPQLPLPGGKANWVVAVGGLDPVKASDQTDKDKWDNWVRLGYYVFATDGTVSTDFWDWATLKEPVRVDIMKARCGGNVPECHIKTAQGFVGGTMRGYRGVYSYMPNGQLQVRWLTDAAGNPIRTTVRESWNLETGLIGNKLARISSPTFRTGAMPSPRSFSSYGATFGIGYGSNASLASTSRASMTQLRNDPRYDARAYTGSYVLANDGKVSHQETGGDWHFGSGSPDPKSPNHANPWRLCSGAQCIGWVQRVSSCEDTTGKDPNKDRVRYIAELGTGRQNTEWYWCQFLAQKDECYRSNSHPRPMLQVVGDDGVFQGWVGAEAFTHVKSDTMKPDQKFDQAHFGVFDMVAPPLSPKR